MKYFKVRDLKKDVEFYISSMVPNETPTHLAMTMHLGEGDGKYDIIELSKEEFDRENAEEPDALL